jgi:hypothetical protein
VQRDWVIALASVLIWFGAVSFARSAMAGPPPFGVARFDSPKAAFDALVTSIRDKDEKALLAILGKGAQPLVRSGDPVADAQTREKFLAEYDTAHALDRSGNTVTLTIGDDDWPFPIPLRHDVGGWWFDLAAGREEVLDRRIGRNELDTETVMLAYVDAQNDYAASFHDGLKVHAYAQKFLSAEGRQDGLYWPTEEGEPPSPLGPLIAEAAAAGYHHAGPHTAPQPYHGYQYKILNAQGPHAPGGAYNYVVNGIMIGGFGLLAYPARYGASGIKSFIVNQEGVIYEKDLGPRTAELAASITRFDPDSTWHKTDAP